MGTYLTSTSKKRRAHIEIGLKLVGTIMDIEGPYIQELDEVDWKDAWKDHFSLLRIGDNIVIKMPWMDFYPKSHEVVIDIEPGLAFGTGYHPTTQMCLTVIDELIVSNASLLDVGAGSGILSVAASKLGAGTVVALDVDPEAMKVARKTMVTNGLKGKIRMIQGTLPHKAISKKGFDFVVANISAEVIGVLGQELWSVLKPGGRLVVSGFLDTQEHDLKSSLQGVGLVLQGRRQISDWVSLILTRR
jgi:ribosomal protein L11 methyltransferase